jgi:hypothetical protein
MSTDPLRARLSALVATWEQPADASAFGTEVGYAVYNEARRDCALDLAALLREPPAAASLDAEAKLHALRGHCRDCRRVNPDDVHTPAIAECIRCGELDCPHNEPLHYHHDGCPACHGTVDAARAAAPKDTR